MGSGVNPWAEFSVPLAQWIATQNYHLLTGGGAGVMAAASQAFCQVEKRAGVCLGILPTDSDGRNFIPCNGYPNPWVELSIISPLSRFQGGDTAQLSRNHICILSSDIVVALPGNKGTKNEVELAILFDKPIILFGAAREFADFPPVVEKTTSINRVKEFILSHSKESIA